MQILRSFADLTYKVVETFKVIVRCEESHCRDREAEIRFNFKKKTQGKVDVIFLNFILKKQSNQNLHPHGQEYKFWRTIIVRFIED